MSGCGPTAVERCKARRPNQSQAVYGCITTSNDVGEPTVRQMSGISIQEFETEPPPTPGDGLAPLAETKSDEEGFYTLSPRAGGTWLCTAFRRCMAVTVPEGTAVRMDYDFGLGPGWMQPR